MIVGLQIATIKEILEIPLRIPVYQRPYKWSIDSALTLVIDCCNACWSKLPEYRIGTIVLHRFEDKNKNENFDIVDGQQRMTTISLILYSLSEILECPYDNCLLDEKYSKSLSQKPIIDNYRVITKKLSEIGIDDLRKFLDYLLNNCTLVKIVTDKEQEAFQFFDSQNSRGKPLAPHDLLKSYHLREMRDDPESEKIGIVNEWEEMDQDELKDLFSDNLFPLVRWYKGKSGLGYSEKDIRTFKGIRRKSTYNFSVYNKAANLYIENINKEGLCEIVSGSLINQFQLTQPLIAGKRFFRFSQNYMRLYETVGKYVSGELKDLIILRGRGDLYVYNMFINALMFFIDRFDMESLTYPRLQFFYKWAYSLRICLKTVYIQSVDKYARGLHERMNNGLNIFAEMAEMSDPMEIDAIILQDISGYLSGANDKYRNVIGFLQRMEGSEK